MNKVWLVTGSASGLGRNIAEAVLESGDRLVATARDTKRLDDLVKIYGDRVRAIPLDVTNESAAQAAVQTAVAAFGRLDVVVNNAGYGMTSRKSMASPLGAHRQLSDSGPGPLVTAGN
jgi:NAD(P)-dependent dehydrogenase (short-subunit alcohol dehydrogenase family)